MTGSTNRSARGRTRSRRPPSAEFEARQIEFAPEPAAGEDLGPSDTRAHKPTTVYRDIALRVLLVVEHAGQLWLVPPKADGWSGRSRIEMTAEARQDRLRPARDIDAEWLGISSSAACEISTETSAEAQA